MRSQPPATWPPATSEKFPARNSAFLPAYQSMFFDQLGLFGGTVFIFLILACFMTALTFPEELGLSAVKKRVKKHFTAAEKLV